MISSLLLSAAELVAADSSTSGPVELRRSLVGRQAPDVVVLEVDARDPVPLVRTVRSALPEPHLLVIGPEEDGPVGAACLRHGADGVLAQHTVRDGLLVALHRLRAGQVVLDADTSQEVLRSIRVPRPAPGSARLSPTEERILDLMATGATNQHIAGQLGLAEKTVKNYATGIYRTLGATNRAQAVGLWLGTQ